MKSPILSAEFITADPAWGLAVPYFRRSFCKNGALKKATLYISSLGVFVARINGKRVGEDYMAPGWTNYKKRLQYFEYDVTDMLTDDNEITVPEGVKALVTLPDGTEKLHTGGTLTLSSEATD